MMRAHAILSPSSAHRWLACAGSVALSHGLPDEQSEDAASGTASHALACIVFTSATRAANYFIGSTIEVGKYSFVVDENRAERVQTYVDAVREYAAVPSATLLIEQRLPIGHLTGEEGAEGTGDAIILLDDEIQVHDLKDGFVRVDAKENPQLMMYGLGALERFGLLGDFKRFRGVIHQLQLNRVDEWDCSIDELRAFAHVVREGAKDVARANANPTPYLFPSENACRYCPARATCPALAAKVQEDIGADFTTIAKHDKLGVFDHNLSACMQAIPLIRIWAKAVEEEVERRMMAGETIDGFKLVQGRRRPRQWIDEAATEAALRAFRLKHDQIFDYALASPTRIEKVLAKESPKRWEKLQELITQSPGSASVVPVSDKRPALAAGAVAADFADETSAERLT